MGRSTLEYGTLSEAEVVQHSARGDRDAYKILVDRYQTRAFAVAYEIMKNREDAEDVTQEAFVKAFFALDSFNQEANFFTWFYRIVCNMALDIRRKNVRRGTPLSYQEENREERSDVVGEKSEAIASSVIDAPDRAIEKKEEAVRLRRALHEISDEHRSVVILREVDGLSYDEIAEKTGVSKGTVMSRLHYARKRLQEALQG